LLATIGAGLATGASNKIKVKSKVTIKHQGSDYGDSFSGKVKAKPKKVKGKAKKKLKKKCVKKRKVTVFQKVPGGKERVGATKTNRKGRWVRDAGGLVEPGRYYAQAKKKKTKVKVDGVKVKAVCKKGKSKRITVS
jgi:hypothetical protein